MCVVCCFCYDKDLIRWSVARRERERERECVCVCFIWNSVIFVGVAPWRRGVGCGPWISVRVTAEVGVRREFMHRYKVLNWDNKQLSWRKWIPSNVLSLSLSRVSLCVFVFFPSFPAKYVIFCRLLFSCLVLHDLVYFRECNMCVCAELRLSSGPRLSTSREFPDFWVMDVADFARIVSIAAASVKPLLLASWFMLLNPLYVP